MCNKDEVSAVIKLGTIKGGRRPHPDNPSGTEEGLG